MHDQFLRQMLQFHAEDEHGHDDESAADAQKAGQHAGHGADGEIQGKKFKHGVPRMKPHGMRLHENW